MEEKQVEVRLRVTESEYQVLAKAAEDGGESIANYVRAALGFGARERGGKREGSGRKRKSAD